MLVRNDTSQAARVFFALLSLAAIAHGSAPTTSPSASAGAKANWPQWRGPLASGVAPLADPPTTWSEDANVRWKVKLPGSGTSTPIIWNDVVFVTTALPARAANGAGADNAARNQPAPPPAEPGGPPPGARRGGERRGGGAGPAPTEPYKFVLLCLDRATGKTRW